MKTVNMIDNTKNTIVIQKKWKVGFILIQKNIHIKTMFRGIII